MSDLRPRSPRRAELWLAPRVSQGNLNSDELPQCSGAWRPAADGWHSGYHKVTGAAAARRGRGRRASGALGGKVGSQRTPEKCQTEGHVSGRAWPPASQLRSPEGAGHPPALPGAWPPLIALTSAGLRARRSAELPAGERPRPGHRGSESRTCSVHASQGGRVAAGGRSAARPWQLTSVLSLPVGSTGGHGASTLAWGEGPWQSTESSLAAP